MDRLRRYAAVLRRARGQPARQREPAPRGGDHRGRGRRGSVTMTFVRRAGTFFHGGHPGRPGHQCEANRTRRIRRKPSTAGDSDDDDVEADQEMPGHCDRRHPRVADLQPGDGRADGHRRPGPPRRTSPACTSTSTRSGPSPTACGPAAACSRRIVAERRPGRGDDLLRRRQRHHPDRAQRRAVHRGDVAGRVRRAGRPATGRGPHGPPRDPGVVLHPRRQPRAAARDGRRHRRRRGGTSSRCTAGSTS